MNNNKTDGFKLSIGNEYPPAEEDNYINKMAADLKAKLIKQYPEGQTLRSAHPKMHGCVKAEFTISGNLDDDLRVGLFREPKTFNAFIRFSNASSEIKHDMSKDVRGMAIKLTGVPGEKLYNNPVNTDSQDFNLISHDVFISRDVKEFYKVLHALNSGKTSLLLFMLNPMHYRTVRLLMQSLQKCDDVLNIPYRSATPYLFGNGRAVKYQVTPVNPAITTGMPANSNENYLRANMVKTLSEQDVLFDFAVQFQTDPYLMPIEDPTVRWNSPFINVAKIRIPKQIFDTDEQNHLGDGFSFSPWHSLPEHRPLGGLNRARRKIYDVMSTFWHERNNKYSSNP